MANENRNENGDVPRREVDEKTSDASIALRPGDDTTLSYVETLLEQNGLPSQDVRSKPDCFYVGYDDDDPVGVGGVEIYDTDGLLRSVVVEESARANGLGTAICETLETKARTDGVETLHLLTTTVPDFFANRGYVRIERADAPATIRRTTEFDELCPASATCMKKSLSQ